jgi:VWFA-related protein
MVTGSVLVQARASDPRVTLVKWCVGDWARTTPPPFDFVLDVGPVPAERHVRALGLDGSRQPLYEREVTLNPGARGLAVSFVTPVPGEMVEGPMAVTLEALVPADDAFEELEVEAGDARMKARPLEGSPGLYGAVAVVPPGPVPIMARLVTKRGRRAESTIVVNTRGLSATAESHLVEQMVGVYRGSEPVTTLGAKDFEVKDETGTCEVRGALLANDTPLALGFAVDTSLSIRHNMTLLAATADRFLTQCFRPADSGFVIGFGPMISRLQDWTSDAAALESHLHDLPDPSMAGTALYEAIVKALYQFQGSQGARALILITDGYDYDGDVAFEDALAYARQSGVKIYALALSTRSADLTLRRTAKETFSEWKYSTHPPNLAVLERFTSATGGRTLVVNRAEQLGPSFEKIERDLRTQYLVSFSSRARRRAAFHPVEITARQGRAVTAAGYYS